MLLGCSSDPAPKTLDRAALLDPTSCKDCHAEHYNQWAGSMHAYAADDPVFIAMNARGQEEAQLGDFCVTCHAPMAVRENAFPDGDFSKVAQLPRHLKGVTCYFCHSADGVEDTHNNPLRISDDLMLRGSIPEPVDNTAHLSGYSPLLDRDTRQSADMCGACHDIVTKNGLHLERTYLEWKESMFGNGAIQQLTCGNCHMDETINTPIANYAGVPNRKLHNHRFPAFDVALTEFPFMDDQRAAVEDELDTATQLQVCVDPTTGAIELSIENTAAGHSFPSGAAQDRRVWAEVQAWDAADELLLASGVATEGEPVAELPDVWLFRDILHNDQGEEVHMFWEATTIAESNLLLVPSEPNAPHLAVRVFEPSAFPSRVAVRLLARPMGLEVLQDLVDSGHLEASVIDAVPTFVVHDTVEWPGEGSKFDCVGTLPQ